MGLCVQAGLALGNENLGIFLYALIQWSIDILAIAWAFRALAALGAAAPAARIAAFAFTALVPAFSNYSVLVTKDVLFAAALLVYAVELVYLVCGVSSVPDAASDAAGASAPRSASFPAGHVALARGLRLGGDASAQRHGGSPSPPAPWWRSSLARGRRRFALVSLAACLGVSLVLSQVVYPALSITPTSRRETLSIPVPAGGALYARQSRAGADEDRAIVDKVLDADAIAGLYDPIISDPVKATYRIDATSEDLAAFLGLWARWLAEDPACYLTATAANYYGYFYPGSSLNWSYPSSFSRRAMANTATTLTYSDIARTSTSRPRATRSPVALDAACSLYRAAFQYLPVLTLTMQAALYDWALVLATGLCGAPPAALAGGGAGAVLDGAARVARGALQRHHVLPLRVPGRAGDALAACAHDRPRSARRAFSCQISARPRKVSAASSVQACRRSGPHELGVLAGDDDGGVRGVLPPARAPWRR